MRVKLLLASSNTGKRGEYRALAASPAYEQQVKEEIDGHQIEVELLPGFDGFPAFAEDAPTFAENAAGKALHYSRFSPEIVFADDSGLVVPSLGGAPGVRSARYAGEKASDAERNAKLLAELRGKHGYERRAKFVCVIAAAKCGRMLAVVSDFVEGEIADGPRGAGGFGYDPVFYFAPAGNTFGELASAEKNAVGHRGKAFRKLRETLRP